MRISSILIFTVLAAALPAATVGCSASDPNNERSASDGTSVVSLSLTSTTASGAQYRLATGTFTIVGSTSAVVSAQDYLSAAVITQTLTTGTYTVTLASGWQLQQLVNGAWVNVAATLVSANPSTFAVTEGSVTQLAYRFQVGTEVVDIGTGTLQLSVQVTDTSNCTPATLSGFAWTPASTATEAHYKATVAGLPSTVTLATAFLVVGSATGPLQLSFPTTDLSTLPYMYIGAESSSGTKYYMAQSGSLGVTEASQPLVDRSYSASISNSVLVEIDPTNLAAVAGGGCLKVASATINIAPVTVPSAWTCGVKLYSAHDGCDCNCGAPDPDCVDATASIYNCPPQATCSAAGICEGGVTGWTCAAGVYASGGACNCNCGVWDPDCNNAAATVSGCTGGATCAQPGVCQGGTPLPATWTCSAAFFGASDGCDCNCGAWDPDCDTPNAPLFRCATGQTCVQPGVCQ